MPLHDVRPDPKPVAGAKPKTRGRKRATQADWRMLHAAKQGPCRICDAPPPNHLHHLIFRSQGGPDTPDNLLPLCLAHHDAIHARDPEALVNLALRLTDGEYAFVHEKLGEAALERLFGVLTTEPERRLPTEALS